MLQQVHPLVSRNACCDLEGGMAGCSKGLQIFRFPASILIQLLLALSYAILTNISVVVNLSFPHMSKVFLDHHDYLLSVLYFKNVGYLVRGQKNTLRAHPCTRGSKYLECKSQ